MNETMFAVPELRRLAPDALRMAGLPLGQADEIAEMVVWTEAVHGGALRFLREARARLLWVPRPRIALTTIAPDEYLIDARGGSFLEFGISIADFLCGETSSARDSGTRSHTSARVTNVYGKAFLPYLAWRSETRGFSFMVHASDAPKETDREGGAELCEDYELTVQPATRSEPSVEFVDSQSKYLLSVENGVVTDQDDFDSFVQLFEMLRVPTSERSRTHAG
jgi:hypothetical protein